MCIIRLTLDTRCHDCHRWILAGNPARKSWHTGNIYCLTHRDLKEQADELTLQLKEAEKQAELA